MQAVETVDGGQAWVGSDDKVTSRGIDVVAHLGKIAQTADGSETIVAVDLQITPGESDVFQAGQVGEGGVLGYLKHAVDMVDSAQGTDVVEQRIAGDGERTADKRQVLQPVQGGECITVVDCQFNTDVGQVGQAGQRGERRTVKNKQAFGDGMQLAQAIQVGDVGP